jgi:hypothetical protein
MVSAPALNSPANGATGVAAAPALAWTAGSNATCYDVHLGTADSPVLVATMTVPAYISAGALTAGTTYYWRVVAKNSGSSARVARSHLPWRMHRTAPRRARI